MSLKQRTFSAIRWTTAGAVARAALQVIQVSVLARLLLPQDYGLMAMVAVVLSFAGLFADAGMSSAFIQRQDVTEEQRSSLFWLNVAMGLSMTVLVIAASPALAWFFNDQRLAMPITLSATTFLIGALGQQIRVAAEKNLDFRPVAILELSAAVAGFLVAIAGALLGWGVYALVAGGIFNAICSTALAWALLARGWRPLNRLKMADVRSFLGFGGSLVANNVVNQINSTIDIFLGGRLLGAVDLGLYSIPRNLALQVQLIINPIITRVGFPLIAQVQADVARVRMIYLKTLNMTASSNAPIYVGMAFLAPECAAILLGPGWERSGELLRVLALWGGVRSLANPVGSLLFGMGRADLSLKWNVGLMLIIPAFMWLGAQYGPEGMAWMLLAMMIVLFVPAWFVLVRPLCSASLAEYSAVALRPFILAALAVASGYFAADQFDGALSRLAVAILISAPLYVALSFIWNREWVTAMLELAGRGKTLA